MPAEFGARLERIEQGIESVSIEVERISESQRYLLKVQGPDARAGRDSAERELTDGFGQSRTTIAGTATRSIASPRAAERARTARTIIALAEQLLERRVRNALDIGCGEGLWRAALRRERPQLAYLGHRPERVRRASASARAATSVRATSPR